MKFDIVIPFKDAVNHLPTLCADLEKQIHQDFTAHFVSDQSFDGSLDFLKKDHRFQLNILESPGSGPGTARNEGMKHASGEYILFIDADDRIADNYTQRFYDKARASNADIIECMYQSIDQNGIVISGTNIETFISSSDRFLALTLGDIPRLSWGKAYKRSFLEKQNAFFPNNIHNGEDHIFLLQAYKNSPHIEIICERLYSWMRHPESLTNRKVTHKTVEDFVKVSESKSNILESTLGHSDLNSEVFLKFARRTFKEARILISKIKSENNDAQNLIDYLRNQIIDSTHLFKMKELLKIDNTSYWKDVIG